MKINYYKISNSLIAKHLVKSNYIRMLLEQMKVMLDLNWEKIKYTLVYVLVCAFSEKMIRKYLPATPAAAPPDTKSLFSLKE